MSRAWSRWTISRPRVAITFTATASCCSTSRANSAVGMDKSVQRFWQRASLVRWSWLKRAISPRIAPGPSSAIVRPPFKTSTAPSAMTKKQVPGEPSSMIRSPAANDTSRPRETRACLSAALSSRRASQRSSNVSSIRPPCSAPGDGLIVSLSGAGADIDAHAHGS